MELEFLDPNNKIEGKERKSKLLKPDSQLYQYIDGLRQYIERVYVGRTERRIDLHVELVKKGEMCTIELLNQRSLRYEGTLIDIYNIIAYGKAIAVQCPSMFGHDDLHISITYFTKGLPKDIMYTITNFAACNASYECLGVCRGINDK